eukprot:2811916-Rhodomonas_salina.1
MSESFAWLVANGGAFKMPVALQIAGTWIHHTRAKLPLLGCGFAYSLFLIQIHKSFEAEEYDGVRTEVLFSLITPLVDILPIIFELSLECGQRANIDNNVLGCNGGCNDYQRAVADHQLKSKTGKTGI